MAMIVADVPELHGSSDAEGALVTLSILTGAVMIVAGLGFKITAVPFHFYAPDVYQGATNGGAAILAAL